MTYSGDYATIETAEEAACLNHDQGEQYLGQEMMPPGQAIDGRLTDIAIQRTGLKEIVRLDEQAGSCLCGQHQQQGNHRQRAQRVVTRGATWLPLTHIADITHKC